MTPFFIPDDAIIPQEKLTHYLLKPRLWDDKSRFLSRAGFHPANAVELEAAIRRVSTEHPAFEDGVNEYGTFYRIDGVLHGPVGGPLSVTMIW